ncbi:MULTISPECIES: IS3 family transposase [Bacillus]|uniref:IS3 family transposase n=1 Tax=Bacillus TaxID=1386 RepID=UPI000B44E808|nr:MULTISPECIES: IS3 family transposase [Bacillus cereus group]KAB0447927.1 IS3 family transposase [Lysinibacillus sp. VIA-II-2016]MBE7139677.1 IS3 family transposase [Bacillus toyonensis]MBE7163681.1 IS3 family transposase [Bacillus toyonensis]MBJ8132084.1 IS3 family transposase [Bacillus cereus group sp. N3]MDR4973219.1 IS3 family transposase [Bacillus toyonensis]
MKTRVHYPEEVKWKVIEMKKDGYSNRTIMEKLGIKNVSQIKTWMKWYRTNQTYRFQQPVGKQYSYGKGSKELNELEQLRLENKPVKNKITYMGKVSGNRKELNPETVVTLWNDFKTKIALKELCNVLELPRSTFYRWLQRTEDLRNDIEEKIKDVCLRHKLRYGYRRVTAVLRKMGLCINHKKVLRIMNKYHILSKVRRKKKKYINGTEPVVAPHRLERQFEASAPNEKWFTDVTYLLFGERTLYLSTIMDAFNREIISYVISESQTLALAMKTLKQAMRGRKVKDVLLHSNQGSIYTAKEFQAYAKEKGIITSMSRRGNCHDNAVMESFFGHLKSEAFYSQKITKVSNTTVRKIVLEYIHYYNCVRIQGKLNHLSPKEFREQMV